MFNLYLDAQRASVSPGKLNLRVDFTVSLLGVADTLSPTCVVSFIKANITSPQVSFNPPTSTFISSIISLLSSEGLPSILSTTTLILAEAVFAEVFAEVFAALFA